ncbi:hypothetical protein EXIGLDRAFT_442888 [Exidia glandulosa HHB12029]|uniref:Uncharacterized protein n=1 Tax=Exidia glandulosa HHB12029 TaxID=1314781 RepID=A0A165KCN9_EXIGL|nr:hypothetical protein EXIGLDRAFT_442888 [Exidia glandulosa HHB12029]
MAGRAQPVDWKAPKLRVGASLKQFAHKVADLYENRHEGATKPTRARRHGHSPTPSTATIPASSSALRRDDSFSSQWVATPSRQQRAQAGQPQGAQTSFVSISDSEESSSSFDEGGASPAEISSEPGGHATSLESLLASVGLETTDPVLVQQMTAVLEEARRRQAARAVSRDGPRSALPQAPSHGALSEKAAMAARRRGQSLSHRTAHATSSTSRTDGVSLAPLRSVPARPLPPPPPPFVRAADPAHIQLPPSPELARPMHSLDAVARGATASPSPTIDRGTLRNLAHDPEATLAFLQELMQHVATSQTPRPASPVNDWPDEQASRSDSLPPYRRDVSDSMGH